MNKNFKEPHRIFNKCIPRLVRNVLLVAALSCSTGAVLANDITGPSSSQSPYLLRARPGVVTVSLLTVGDSVNLKPDGITPYRMVGIPDGLGAFHSHGHEFTLLMNHELGGTSGVVRRHGSKGAFVSQWVIDHKYLKVIEGQDFTQSANNVFSWDPATITCEGR